MKLSEKFKKIYLLALIPIGAGIYFMAKPTPRESIKLSKSTFSEDILVSGTIKSKNIVTLSSQVPGKIAQIKKDEGDSVTENEVIAVLDPTDTLLQIEKEKENYNTLKANLDKLSTTDLENARSTFSNAKEQLQLSKSEYDKYQSLFNKNLVSEVEYNQKKSKFIQDSNNLRLAENNFNSLSSGNDKKKAIASLNQSSINIRTLNENLEKLNIKSPVAGIITKKNIADSAYVNPASALFEVSSSEEKILEFNIDEKYASKIFLGQGIEAFFNSNPNVKSTGKIYYIAPFVDSNNGTVEVRATLDEIKPEFLYNITLNAKVFGKPVEGAIVIDDNYIVTRNEKHYVLKVDGDKLVPTEITLPPNSFSRVMVLTGLSEGDEIVLPTEKILKGVKIDGK